MAYRHTDYRLRCRNPHSKGFAAYDPEQAPHSGDDDPVAQSCADCRHGSSASPGAAPIGWTYRSRGAFTRIDCGRPCFPNRFSHEKLVCHRHRRDPDFGGAPLVFLIKCHMMHKLFSQLTSGRTACFCWGRQKCQHLWTMHVRTGSRAHDVQKLFLLLFL